MTISFVSNSVHLRRLFRTTPLLDFLRPFQNVAQKYHALILETFHIPATSLCINYVFVQRATQPAALRAPLNK
jgi:hypothetical protein